MLEKLHQFLSLTHAISTHLLEWCECIISPYGGFFCFFFFFFKYIVAIRIVPCCWMRFLFLFCLLMWAVHHFKRISAKNHFSHRDPTFTHSLTFQLIRIPFARCVCSMKIINEIQIYWLDRSQIAFCDWVWVMQLIAHPLY